MRALWKARYARLSDDGFIHVRRSIVRESRPLLPLTSLTKGLVHRRAFTNLPRGRIKLQVTTALKPNFLRACLVIAAARDIRYYLNGVMVEMTSTETRYVGCDGHRLLVLRDERDRQAPQAPGSIIIPRETIELLPRQKSKTPTVGVKLHYDDTAPASTESRLENVYFKPIDGKFPDYRKAIPKGVSGDRGSYKPEYVLSFNKAAQIAGTTFNLPELWMNGDGAGVVLIDGHPEFIGLVMPLRNPSSGKIPDWITPAEPSVEPVAANSQSEAVAA